MEYETTEQVQLAARAAAGQDVGSIGSDRTTFGEALEKIQRQMSESNKAEAEQRRLLMIKEEAVGNYGALNTSRQSKHDLEFDNERGGNVTDLDESSILDSSIT